MHPHELYARVARSVSQAAVRRSKNVRLVVQPNLRISADQFCRQRNETTALGLFHPKVAVRCIDPVRGYLGAAGTMRLTPTSED